MLRVPARSVIFLLLVMPVDWNKGTNYACEPENQNKGSTVRYVQAVLPLLMRGQGSLLCEQ
ncbi:MAG: hypothetical protein NVS2B12_20210 [Ktedonobacteraceae bacterium]